MNPMWNLDKMFAEAENNELVSGSQQRVDGRSKAECGRELLERCKQRDARLEQNAIESERDGDAEGTWFAMAARAQNKRFMEQLEKDLAAEPRVSSPIAQDQVQNPAQRRIESKP